jgi:predicted RNA-binding protein with RPS1 domain
MAVLYNIYRGTVDKILKVGAIVKLDGVTREPKDGMVHMSLMGAARTRVDDPGKVVSRGQKVYVKVISTIGKLTLSMSDCNQRTGEDVAPQRQRGYNEGRKKEGGDLIDTLAGEGKIFKEVAEMQGAGRMKTQFGDYERWEISQLKRSGVIASVDHDDVDDEVRNFSHCLYF